MPHSTTMIKAALFCVLAASATLAQAMPGPKEEAAPAMQSADSDVSYTACYFNNNGNISWKWGLTPANDWYSFSGSWFTTRFTKLQKFRAKNASFEALQDSCNNAKRYYKVQGDLLAFFAATSGAGSNYPIILANGTELFPEY